MRAPLLVTLLTTLATAVCSLGYAAEPAATLRVMSFNIRYGTADDGPNHWRHRKDLVVETITAFKPDLLGTQETLADQRDYLVERLKGRGGDGYAVFAAGRDDGKEAGEMTPIFYRKDRFEKLDGGHFWLSDRPEVAGSKAWDAALPRIVSWVKLRDDQAAGKPTLWFFNTHFDHLGKQTRAESARLLQQRIRQLKDGPPVIVAGDFNDAPGSPTYAPLFSAEGTGKPLLRDTFRVAHPQRGKLEGTFNGFQPDGRDGSRIDWIGCSHDWQVVEARIDHTVRDGRTPSDHFPVTAVLRYPKQP
jgi:endonuclease/exonuclease/phosphatase family metal-dependent hydrolase